MYETTDLVFYSFTNEFLKRDNTIKNILLKKLIHSKDLDQENESDSWTYVIYTFSSIN